ncbi:MAG: tight adherence protein [Clostridia bacterium]|nr:tight adherence protein [Clostridia bacterium]
MRIKGEIRTLTAQGRLSGLIIGLLPLVLLGLLFVINPVYVATLFSDPLGILLVGGAALGEVLGIAIIRRIVDIRV